MDQRAETLRNRIDFCRELLRQGVSAPDADRLTRTIMELEVELEAQCRHFAHEG
jgi:hypothetical protein